MRFKVYSKNEYSGDKAVFYYDNITSEIYREDGSSVEARPMSKTIYSDSIAGVVSIDTPGKKGFIDTLKIQMGLSCNYGCTYCSQRFVPHADETAQRDIVPFMEKLNGWLKNSPRRIEFWGGEPFVYWKTFKPLAEELRKKFPEVPFTVITNGSLLTIEINEWLEKMDFGVGISHDGPGQWQRGPDPFDEPEVAAAILDLYSRLRPKKRISFNSVLTAQNSDRGAILKWFVDKIGDPNVPIGEGAFVDPYDEGAMLHTEATDGQWWGIRRKAFEGIRNATLMNFEIVPQRMKDWVDSIANKRNAYTLGQKCGMDSSDKIAVDLKGNVLTCQNVSSVATSMNGESHKIGHIDDFDNIKLNTATHWSKRPHCTSCPVLQVCKGSCMFLEGKYWWRGCDTSYNDHVPFWAAAMEAVTDFKPYRIEGEGLPEHRMNIWGDDDKIEEKRYEKVVTKKVIPILAA